MARSEHTTGTPSAGGPNGSFTTLDNKNRKFYTREDWGCDECDPGGDLTGRGFVCGYHRARAVLAATGEKP